MSSEKITPTKLESEQKKALDFSGIEAYLNEGHRIDFDAAQNDTERLDQVSKQFRTEVSTVLMLTETIEMLTDRAEYAEKLEQKKQLHTQKLKIVVQFMDWFASQGIDPLELYDESSADLPVREFILSYG